MKNHTKKTLEDAIPTLIEGYKVMSAKDIEKLKEPQFEVIEFKDTFHIVYSWFIGEKYVFGNDPELSGDDNKQFEKNTIIINKSQKFIEFVESIVDALDTITENNYNYNL